MLDLSALNKSFSEQEKLELLQMLSEQLKEGIHLFNSWLGGEVSLEEVQFYSHKIKSKFLLFNQSDWHAHFDQIENLKDIRRRKKLSEISLTILNSTLENIDAEFHNHR